MANYKGTDTDLVAVANAIRVKGGAGSLLEWPSGYISAINAIPTPLKIVSWSTATGEQIAAMIHAAENGDIDLQEDAGWAVGDVKSISIASFTVAETTFPQQDIDIVITSFDDYMGCGCLMQFDFKDCISPAKELHSEASSRDGYYANTIAYTEILPALILALPSWLRNILTEFPVRYNYINSSGYNIGNEKVALGKLALRSLIEVGFQSTLTPGDALDYYQTNSNRIKNLGHEGSPTAWWLINQTESYGQKGFIVLQNGNSDSVLRTNSDCFAPFGCLGKYPILGDNSWSNGTDEQIVEAINSAVSGEIDLQQDLNWQVGDIRTIRIDSFTDSAGVSYPAQYVDLVISSFEDYMNCGCVMQFDFKSALEVAKGMNDTTANAGGFEASKLRTVFLPALYNALPDWLKSVMLEFACLYTTGGYDAKVETSSGNMLALRAESEIYGTTGYVNEGEQVAYYADSQNRIKTLGKYCIPAKPWWLRTAKNYASSFWRVRDDGTSNNDTSNNPNGVSPFGCLGVPSNS